MRYVLSLPLFLVLAVYAQAAVIYVDADAATGGDGTSWDSAFTYLQDAIDQTVAGQGDELWIAEGTYYPDDGANVTEGDRTASFILKDGVALYGGFVGSESSLLERDWETYITTLSGKIYIEQIYWSLHVCTVVGDGSVSFDGLTITGGNANGTGADQDQAAAVYSSSTSYQVMVSNSSFRENTADENGGVASGGVWIVVNSDFDGNSTDKFGGVSDYGSWTVTDSSFSRNSAVWFGGVANRGNWNVTNSSFRENTADENGGVAYDSRWTVTDSNFIQNSAGRGGVAYGAATEWTVTNCSFSGNFASNSGGVAEYGSWNASESRFSNNSASRGGVFDNCDNSIVTNCSFSDNSAQSGGVVSYSKRWIVTNCIFGGNASSSSGGVAHGCDDWIVTNSSFGENSSGAGGVAGGYGDWTVTNCSFGGNSASVGGGVGHDCDWTVFSSSFSGNSSPIGSVAGECIWTVANSVFDATNSGLSNFLFEDMDGFTNTTDSAPSPISPRGANIIEGGMSVIDIAVDGFLEVGTGYVIDADPLFVNALDPDGPDDIYGTADDGLRLQASSPAIAQGDATFLPLDTQDIDNDGITDEVIPLDLAGFLRVQDGSLDLGAYEYGNATYELFTLSLLSGVGGTVTPSGVQDYEAGTLVDVTATPSGGYLFDAWTGDASGSTNPLDVTMNQNLSITANFTPDANDDDEDGLTNFQELVTYGTNPNLKDSNGDDLPDGDVVSAGFDPTIDFSPLISVMSQHLEDARTGSTMVNVNGSNALLQLQLQRSDDLSEWSKDPEDIIEVEIPMSPGKSFFRFAIPEN